MQGRTRTPTPGGPESNNWTPYLLQAEFLHTLITFRILSSLQIDPWRGLPLLRWRPLLVRQRYSSPVRWSDTDVMIAGSLVEYAQGYRLSARRHLELASNSCAIALVEQVDAR